MVKTLSQLYSDTRRALLPSEGADRAGMLARELLRFVTDKTTAQILADLNFYASVEQCDRIEAYTARLMQGEPLAYILGEWEFYGLPLYVDRRVLIPRDDTCAVTDLAIQQALFLGHNPRILDLCTGSGCIGLAIASRVKDAKLTLADISKDALAVAKKNAARNHLSPRVSAVQADATGEPPSFLGKFDMIVSNPPYVTGPEMGELPVSVRDFEPHLALFGGQDGLDFYRSILKHYTASLKPGGYMCFEFGMGQGDAICDLLRSYEYEILERSRDYAGRERAVIARLCGKED